ncbi:MAG: RagB/SusD family nutrient uptake outer membrane protein [Butyricimonas sp.]|nr:RagB/SusD family nutrient uptake outer membrane protein [Butyricimonas sp.]
MKRIKFIIGLLCTCIASACSDFLEEKSQDEVIVKTVEDYRELLIGYMNGSNTYSMLYALDDDIRIDDTKFSAVRDDNNVLQHSGCFTWQPDMWEREAKLPDSYKGTYSQLTGINAVLDGIDEAIGLEADKEIIKAEALSLRALYYYMLVNLYGEPYNYNKKALGVPLKLTAGLVENGIARNTVEEVYAQILKDLKVALGLFEKYPKQRGNYQINITSAYILLSRIYLYMEQWENVIQEADKAIKTAEGLTDYTAFAPGAKFYMTTYDHSEVEWLWGYNLIIKPFAPSEDLLVRYDDKDMRLALWFSTDRLVILKKNVESYAPTNTIRISEAYLNRAEAYAQLEKLTEGLTDLNELRRHRILDYQDISLQDSKRLLEEVRLERRLEFCFDWHRWFDLRRYGMPSISHDYKSKAGMPWVRYTLREKDPLYTLPISTVMMKNNNKLVQNASADEQERIGVTMSNNN